MATAVRTAPRPQRALLRFLTCGSVDDGKSTLIGRLLFDTRAVAKDQLATLDAESARVGTQGGKRDYALLVDGLSAERAQGITIDVAYRYFATPARTFIVADTPGHAQYTRNMVTGASGSDAAIILVDATRGVTEQTRRHAAIVRLLGIKAVALAVNKMDLVGHDATVFAAIAEAFARETGIADARAVPVVGLTGANIAHRDRGNLGWYGGPTLLDWLETVEVEVAGDGGASGAFRLPVQWVNRPTRAFRGYAGTIASGSVAVGDAVRVLPAGHDTVIASILTPRGAAERADAGDAVTLTFATEIDCARGDWIVAGPPPAVADAAEADLVWLGDAALDPAMRLLWKSGTAAVPARIAALGERIDFADGSVRRADTLRLNDVAGATVRFDRAIPLTRYAEGRVTGSAILIDRDTGATVAAAMVRAVSAARARAATSTIRYVTGEGAAAAATGAAQAARAGGRPTLALTRATLDMLGAERAALIDWIADAGVAALIADGGPVPDGAATVRAEALTKGHDEWVI